MNLAPIGISVYTRVEHFKKCIEALKNNILAEQSEIFIFSDAASKVEDEYSVNEVRRYAHSIKGFLKVHVIERKVNNGGTASAALAHREITRDYGKSIFLEDDVVTAPGFLKFMNEALDFYENDKKVFCIGGHTPNLKANARNSKDIYFVRRMHPWGIGLWEDRFNKIIPISKNDLNNKKLIKKLNEYGTDLLYIAKEDVLGNVIAGDVRACCKMAEEDMYAVLPTQTLVKNIGLDGSGIRCGDNDIYKEDLLSSKVQFKFEKYYYNTDAHKEYKKIYDRPSIFKRLIKKIQRILKGKK